MFGNNETKNWIISITALTLIPLFVFFTIYTLDFYFFGIRGAQVGYFSIFYKMSVEDARQIMGGMGEVIAAILGIVITVASIIVQLAATRYTPKITEMFFKDTKNLIVLAFFVITAVYCLLINFIIRGYADNHALDFIPVLGSILNVILLTISVLLIAPYFLYVFYFLEPGNIVKTLELQALDKIKSLDNPEYIGNVQSKTILSVEQLTDISMNAIEQKDKGLATGSIDALTDLLKDYSNFKSNLNKKWFQIGTQIRNNPDFLSMHQEVLNDISKKRCWVEYKILRQFQMLYNESLNKMRDINYIIAINTRNVGEISISSKDTEILKLAIKFFNTYLRATLNAKDVRTAYNVLHQYRLFAEAVLRSGLDDQVLEIANHFKYYGQIAFSMNIPFITETVAYDLTTLCELAFSAGAIVGDPLLDVLLEVDKEAEGEQQEQSLRGVRKAQVKMATYFLLQGDDARAHKIYEDMQNEPAERIKSIRKELNSVKSKDFWEVIDRGENFDYLNPERKHFLPVFFNKFSFVKKNSS
ncbi:MAG: DUF2254 family protein [Myxococcota bacterium]